MAWGVNLGCHTLVVAGRIRRGFANLRAHRFLAGFAPLQIVAAVVLGVFRRLRCHTWSAAMMGLMPAHRFLCFVARMWRTHRTGLERHRHPVSLVLVPAAVKLFGGNFVLRRRRFGRPVHAFRGVSAGDLMGVKGVGCSWIKPRLPRADRGHAWQCTGRRHRGPGTTRGVPRGRVLGNPWMR